MEIQLLDNSTGATRVLAPSHPGSEVGLAISHDRRTALVTAFKDAGASDLTLVEGFE